MLDRLQHNETIGLYIDVKLTKNDKVYFSLNRKAKSFLVNFAAVLFNSMFNRNLTCRDVNGNIFTPRVTTSSFGTFNLVFGEERTYIVLSNSTNDQTLTFNDFKINTPLQNLTVQSGYPRIVIDLGATYAILKIVSKWAYTGPDTFITASALYYTNIYDTAGNIRQVMLAKDVFDPGISLETNSMIDWSYIIKISL